MPGKAVIGLTAGLEDTEKVTVAFLVAVGTAEAGRPTLMFLTKEAVRLALGGVAVGVACDGCPQLPDLMKRYDAAGGREPQHRGRSRTLERDLSRRSNRAREEQLTVFALGGVQGALTSVRASRVAFERGGARRLSSRWMYQTNSIPNAIGVHPKRKKAGGNAELRANSASPIVAAIEMRSGTSVLIVGDSPASRWAATMSVVVASTERNGKTTPTQPTVTAASDRHARTCPPARCSCRFTSNHHQRP